MQDPLSWSRGVVAEIDLRRCHVQLAEPNGRVIGINRHGAMIAQKEGKAYWLPLAGGKILLGAVSGLLAAIVWWAIAIRAADAFVLVAVTGVWFGSAYAWPEARKGP